MTEASADVDAGGPRAGPGVLVVLAGPSGVGKGTVVRRVLAELPTAELSVSATTRDRRPGEVDGEHYHFLDDAAFDRLRDTGRLLEWAEYAGHRYGTPRQGVDERLAAGRDVLLEIEVQGALQVRDRVEGALHVFLSPPSMAELERRLSERGTEDEATRRLRLETARREMAHRHEFDHVVVNDDVQRAAGQIIDLIQEARWRGG